MSKLENTVRDIFSKSEIDFYNKYRIGDELTPYEIVKFKKISHKYHSYNKSMEWIDKLAWACVKNVDPLMATKTKKALYEAYVWGQRTDVKFP